MLIARVNTGTAEECITCTICLDRIRTEGEGGAWCPKDQILKSGNEFLQIDLGTLKVITLVETQGRFGNGQVNTTTYRPIDLREK